MRHKTGLILFFFLLLLVAFIQQASSDQLADKRGSNERSNNQAKTFKLMAPAPNGNFVEVGPTHSGLFLHWDSRKFPDGKIPYYINRKGSDDLTLPEVKAGIEQAFNAWRAATNGVIDFRFAGYTQATGLKRDGQNVISWDETGRLFAKTQNNKNAFAVTSPINFDPLIGELLEADIVFNGSYIPASSFRRCCASIGAKTSIKWNLQEQRCQESLLPLRANVLLAHLQSHATHEIGHFIGLGHSEVSGATMFPGACEGTGQSVLKENDLEAAKFLYKTMPSTPTPAKSEIRRVDFKNFTYHLPNIQETKLGKVRLRNGKYSGGRLGDGPNCELFQVAYGDLTGDGNEEAVVVLMFNLGGSAFWMDGQIFTMKDGRAVLLMKFDAGDRGRGGIRTVTVSNGLLVGDYDISVNGDASCCPSHYRFIKYKWNGSRLVEVEKTPIRKRPESSNQTRQQSQTSSSTKEEGKTSQPRKGEGFGQQLGKAIKDGILGGIKERLGPQPKAPTVEGQDNRPTGNTDSNALPRLPYEDFGACPFECCKYQRWTATAQTAIRNDRQSNSPIVFTLRRGEKFTALTGVVITTKPGRARVLKPISIGGLRVRPGEIVYTLTYLGEGFYKVWYKGKTADVDVLGGDGGDSLKELLKPQSVWWVRLKNSKNQIGWTNQTRNFDGGYGC